MKSKVLFVLIVLILGTTAAVAKKIPGQIIDKSGNARDVTFNIPFKFLSSEPNFERLQYRIVYYDENQQKKVLRPDDAEEINFNYKGVEVRMLSMVNTLGAGSLFNSNNFIFLRLFADGHLKLFRFYYTQTSPGMYNASTGMSSGMYSYGAENYVIQKEGEPLMQPRGLSFRKDMAAYLRDCPEVAEKIRERELRRADLEIIVREYNRLCAAR